MAAEAGCSWRHMLRRHARTAHTGSVGILAAVGTSCMGRRSPGVLLCLCLGLTGALLWEDAADCPCIGVCCRLVHIVLYRLHGELGIT